MRMVDEADNVGKWQGYKRAKAIATELLEKEREIAQDYARFAIECDRKEMPILEFQDWIKL